jgi:kumamolisin
MPRLQRRIAASAAALSLLTLAMSPAQAQAQSAGVQPSNPAARAAVPAAAADLAGAVRLGTADPGARLSLTVGLTSRDQAGLDAFVRAVADPASAQYRRYLTVAQFAQRYGASTGSIAAVTSYLRSAGLAVTAATSNQLTVTATGTAAQAQRAFDVGLADYRAADGRTFYAQTAAPTVPADLSGTVADVAGLSDADQLTHAALTDRSAASAISGPQALRPSALAVLTPTTVREGYNLATDIADGYDGKGVTVALAEFTTYAVSDINKFDSHYSLVVPTPTVVKVDGGTTDTSGSLEADLDIDATQALAPDSSIAVYEAPNSDAGEVALYSAMASADAPVISTSWAEPETEENNLTQDHIIFEEAAAQGESVYAVSGSGSGSLGSVDYPAADSDVTAVGGTDLTLGADGVWSKETADAESGAGPTSFAVPSYQESVNHTAYREVDDVAAAANSFMIYNGGELEQVGGLSVGTVLWAGFTADYDTAAAALAKPAFGYADPFLYTVGASSLSKTVFHDITSGGNGSYNAAPGWDMVSGWGSFNGGNFIADEL